ncbi:MAG: hypothetical protein ACE5FA_01055 [Dehalococcoidia bacterium]
MKVFWIEYQDGGIAIVAATSLDKAGRHARGFLHYATMEHRKQIKKKTLIPGASADDDGVLHYHPPK